MSKQDAGEEKRWVFRLWRVWSVHGSFPLTLISISWPRVAGVALASGLGGGDAEDGEEGSKGFLEVATPVQSNIPLYTINARIFIGPSLLAEVSVSASDVASVPPRKEP